MANSTDPDVVAGRCGMTACAERTPGHAGQDARSTATAGPAWPAWAKGARQVLPRGWIRGWLQSLHPKGEPWDESNMMW